MWVLLFQPEAADLSRGWAKNALPGACRKAAHRRAKWASFLPSAGAKLPAESGDFHSPETRFSRRRRDNHQIATMRSPHVPNGCRRPGRCARADRRQAYLRPDRRLARNPLADAVHRRRRRRLRHEEGAALAAAGQAKLTGRLAVCAGTTGPGSTHLVAGLYEASRDHAPVLALSGSSMGAGCALISIQTTEPDLLFRDVSLYTETISSAAQAPAVHSSRRSPQPIRAGASPT